MSNPYQPHCYLTPKCRRDVGHSGTCSKSGKAVRISQPQDYEARGPEWVAAVEEILSADEAQQNIIDAGGF